MMHAPVGTKGARLLDLACAGCRSGAVLPVAFTMAFQPIVDVAAGRVFAYEALVRGQEGQSAGDILARIEPEMIYKFDQACRVKAIELAGRLFEPDDAKLSINFMPNAVYEPDACIRASLMAARRARFDPQRLMFEFTENEPMRDIAHVRHIAASHRAWGPTIAIDDFGAGHSGLGTASYGRPVATIDVAGNDLDEALIENGLAVPAPGFLKADPRRASLYEAAYKRGIAGQVGAHASYFLNPADWRHGHRLSCEAP